MAFEKKVTPAADLEALQEQVRALTAKIAEQAEALSAAESAARFSAESQGVPFMQNAMEEIPTGRKVKIQRARNPWVRELSKLEFDEVEVPTYYYKIDLPASGGVDIKINGESKYHGQTYEFTLDELRTIKDIVARSWGHEATIRGSNENVFRRPQNRVLSGKAH